MAFGKRSLPGLFRHIPQRKYLPPLLVWSCVGGWEVVHGNKEGNRVKQTIRTVRAKVIFCPEVKVLWEGKDEKYNTENEDRTVEIGSKNGGNDNQQPAGKLSCQLYL